MDVRAIRSIPASPPDPSLTSKRRAAASERLRFRGLAPAVVGGIRLKAEHLRTSFRNFERKASALQGKMKFDEHDQKIDAVNPVGSIRVWQDSGLLDRPTPRVGQRGPSL